MNDSCSSAKITLFIFEEQGAAMMKCSKKRSKLHLEKNKHAQIQFEFAKGDK